MSPELNSGIVDFIEDLRRIDYLERPDLEIQDFINGIERLDEIGPSNTGETYVKLSEYEEETTLYLYSRLSNVDPKRVLLEIGQSNYEKNLDMTPAHFGDEFLSELKRVKIPYSLEEGQLPGVSVFTIKAPLSTIERRIEEMYQKHEKVVY